MYTFYIIAIMLSKSDDRLVRSLTKHSLLILGDLQTLSVSLPPVTVSDREFLTKAFERYITVSRDVDARMVIHPSTCPIEQVETAGDNAFFPTHRKHECARLKKTCHIFFYGDLHIVFSSRSMTDLARTAAVSAMTLIRLFAPENLKYFQISHCANPALKKLPTIGEALDVSNVNSGFTTRSLKSRSITIWRAEEFLKVLKHELIHCIDADELHIDDEDVQDLKEMFSLDQRRPLLLEETYTELLAVVLHCFLVSSHTETHFLELLEIERTFALFQTAKVLKHFGATSFADILRASSPTRFQETTSAFCYYVLKSAVLFDPASFLHFIRKNDSFIAGSRDGKEFARLVKQACFDPRFRAALDSLLLDFNPANFSNFTAKTLRMTALEMRL